MGESLCISRIKLELPHEFKADYLAAIQSGLLRHEATWVKEVRFLQAEALKLILDVLQTLLTRRLGRLVAINANIINFDLLGHIRVTA